MEWKGSPNWGPDGPGVGMQAWTSGDLTLPYPARSVYVTGLGNLVARGYDGVDFTVALPNNFLLPVSITKIYAATSATGVFVIY